MAASNTKRYVAYSRLYHKALRAKDQRNADHYWKLAMKFMAAATAEKARPSAPTKVSHSPD